MSEITPEPAPSKSRYDPRKEIRLPTPTAAWVLAAHVYGVLVPLLLLWAVLAHADWLATRLPYPGWLAVAAGLMMAASAFEAAQNAQDGWQITPDSASGNGAAFCDLCFYWLLAASQAAVLIACFGRNSFAITLAGALVLAYPKIYVERRFAFVPLAILTLLAVAASFVRLGEPLVFLQLALLPLTLVCFRALLLTGRQGWHGFTTLAAASGPAVLALAIASAADGRPAGWTTTALLAVAMLAVAAVVARVGFRSTGC